MAGALGAAGAARTPRLKKQRASAPGSHNHERCVRPIETVLHYVRKLNGMPSRSLPHASDPSAPVAWRCAACDTLVPRSQDPPDACPNCGAVRQDLE